MHFFGNLKCLLPGPLRVARRESTLNTSLSVSNWVCRHSSASSEQSSKEGSVISDKHFLCGS